MLSVADVNLLGDHNLSNVLCATLICCLYGVKPKYIKEGVKTFKGVEHRLQFVKQVNKVKYYNDSKATNIDACIKAVNSFKKSLVLILGGSDKGEHYENLFKVLPKNVKHILVTGDNAPKILLAGSERGFNNLINLANLEEVVMKAKTLAKKNYVVLLAPASASFDAYIDYKHRGQEFVRIVEEL